MKFKLMPRIMRKALTWTTGNDDWIVAFGDTVYYQDRDDLDEGTLAHEEVHLERQKALGKWKWLYRYLTDKEFRLNEEVLAYAQEVYTLCGADTPLVAKAIDFYAPILYTGYKLGTCLRMVEAHLWHAYVAIKIREEKK